MNDVLVKVPDDDLPKLATLYEECVSWAPCMVSFVRMVIRWKKSEKYKDYLNIWSPYNSWEKDGTIVGMLKNHCCEVYVFTLNEDSSIICAALSQSNLIDYSKLVIFYIHEKHVSTMRRYLESKKISIDVTIHAYVYAISPEEAKQLTIECPPDVYLKKLDVSAAKQVNNAWPHRFPGSEEYLKTFLDINGGWGLFLKSTDEMVAWVVKHSFGHLGMLQTEEQHKKKGYASLVTKALSKEIGEGGYWPLGTIMQNNQPSISMFEKIGFRKICNCTFFLINKH